jgi:hypothetical protein
MKCNTQHNETAEWHSILSVVMLNIFKHWRSVSSAVILSCYAECCISLFVMLCVIVLSVVLNVVTPLLDIYTRYLLYCYC